MIGVGINEALYGSCQFKPRVTCIECLLTHMSLLTSTRMEKGHQARNDLLAGAFAGAVGRLLTAPFDVLKIRFQLQSNLDKKYTSVWQAFKSIVKEKGFHLFGKETFLRLIYGYLTV